MLFFVRINSSFALLFILASKTSTMPSKYKDTEDYIANIPEDRVGPFMKLKETIDIYTFLP